MPPGSPVRLGSAVPPGSPVPPGRPSPPGAAGSLPARVLGGAARSARRARQGAARCTSRAVARVRGGAWRTDALPPLPGATRTGPSRTPDVHPTLTASWGPRLHCPRTPDLSPLPRRRPGRSDTFSHGAGEQGWRAEALDRVASSRRPLRAGGGGDGRLTHSHPPSKVRSRALGRNHEPGRRRVGTAAPTIGTFRQGGPAESWKRNPEPSRCCRGQAASHWGTAGGSGCGRCSRVPLPAGTPHLGSSPEAPRAPQTAAPALGGLQKPGHRFRRASPGRTLGPTPIRRPHPSNSPLLGPDAPLRYPSGVSLPAALRTRRGSMPGGTEAAPVMTASTTQIARARAGAPIVGARATTSSGGARGRTAPHGPARAPAGGGRPSGDCGRRRQFVTREEPGRAGAEAAVVGLLRPGSADPRPPRLPPQPWAPGPPGAGRLLPAAVPPFLPLPSLTSAEPSQGGGGKLSRAGSLRPRRAQPQRQLGT